MAHSVKLLVERVQDELSWNLAQEWNPAYSTCSMNRVGTSRKSGLLFAACVIG